MLTVDDYGRIRRAHRDGMSIRAIARTFHHSRRKVRQALANPEPGGYIRSKPPPAPVLGPFKPLIDRILAADQEAPRKQRHTAMQVVRRLRDEYGYAGGYDQVRRYIAGKRRREQETFIPLSHDPGQRAEVDFGHIHVDFPDRRRQVPVLLVTWAYSNCPFALALPTERTEAILHGLVEAFRFFGCVPREVWFDNPRTVAAQILKGRQRKLNERYAALASHYAFEPLFCLPAHAHEKPYVENRVYGLQRRWATPVPTIQDLAALNAHLRRCCLEDRQRTPAGWSETIGNRFQQDRDRALPLPARPFDACIHQPAKVDKYQTVRFDSNRYSVPRSWAFRAVTLKGYVDRVEVVADGHPIARHERCYGRGQQILDPLHYLVTLGRRPAALDHSAVYRNWRLPAVFTELRRALEAWHGAAAGARQYIRVLRLLAEHPLERVRQAIESTRPGQPPHADAIIQRTRRLGQHEGSEPGVPDLSASLCQVRVPVPDLRRFDQLLASGDPTDVPKSHALVEGQLEAVAPAHHGGGV